MDQDKLSQVQNLISRLNDPTLSQLDRERSEHHFNDLRNDDPANVFFSLTKIYANTTAPLDLRTIAGTLLHMSLLAKSDLEGNHPFWTLLPHDLAEFIKSTCLPIPFGDSPALMNTGCQINGALYAIEIGGRGWAELLEKLVLAMDMADSGQYRLKLASITTLNVICDLVASKNLAIPELERKNMISAILMSIDPEQKSEDVKVQGFKALSTSIGFYVGILQDSDTRNYLYERVVKHLSGHSPDIIRAAYEALIETIKPMYQHLGIYLEQIKTRTEELLDNPLRGGNLGILATEFWTTIAQEDLYHKENSSQDINSICPSMDFTFKHYKQFLPKIMLNLKREDNNDGDVQNSLHSASVQALMSCNMVLGDECIHLNQEFIGCMTDEGTPLSVSAALVTFACLIKIISKVQAHSMLSPSYSKILGYLDNPDSRVRKAAVELVLTIAENCPGIMLSRENAQKYFPGFFQFIELSQDYSTAMILCKTFSALVKHVEPENRNIMDIWNLYVEQMSELMFRLAFRVLPDPVIDHMMVEASIELLLSLISKIYTSEMIFKGMPNYINAIRQAYEASSNRREVLADGLMICVAIAVHKSRNDKAKFPFEFYLEIYKCVMELSKQHNFMPREGIYTTGTIFGCKLYLKLDMGLKMAPYAPEMFGILEKCVKESRNEQYINSALEIYGMMSREKCDMLTPQLVENFVIPMLLDRINDKHCNLEAKLVAYTVLGETALSHISSMKPAIRAIFDKLRAGFEGVAQLLAEKTDASSAELAYLARDRILESNSCIAHAFYEENRVDDQVQSLLLENFRLVCQYVIYTCEKQNDPNTAHVAECLGLIADYVVLNPDVIIQVLNREFSQIHELYRILQNKGGLNEKGAITLKYYERHAYNLQ